MEIILKDAQTQMEKSVNAFRQELGRIRAGRASLSILDEVRVDYYGTLTPLNQVATLSVPDPKMITIQPWETKIIPEIEKAILKSGIGLNPSNDGKLVRLPIPNLNEERRKDLVKLIKKHSEESRVAVRMVRREANDRLKKMHDAKELSDDDFKKAEGRIQKLTDETIAKIDQVAEHKEKDLLSV